MLEVIMPKQDPVIQQETTIRNEDGTPVIGVQIVEWNDKFYFVLTKKFRRGTDDEPEWYGGFWFNIDDGEYAINQLIDTFNKASTLLANDLDVTVTSELVIEDVNQ